MRFAKVVLILSFAATAGAAPSAYQQLFVFGDSYSDIGEGYLDGNGPTAVAYLAENLGFHLTPADKSQSPEQSLDFAISGAQTGAGKGERIGAALLSVGMQNQVEDFKRRFNDGKIRFDPDKTLFFLAGGLNDGKLPTQTTVNNLEGEIRTLYKLGARHFEVALMPTAIPGFAEVGLRLNPALKLIPGQMQSELPSAQISLSQWGPFFDEVRRAPDQFGIHDIKNACAGREIFHEDPKPCSTPDDHYYYHGEHPSTAVHKIVGAKLAHEIEDLSSIAK